MVNDKRGRYWAFLVYPDSAPIDWKDKIQRVGCPFAVSPLHDKDINEIAESDGSIRMELKKAHYHCVICYNNSTTFKSVKENICDVVNGPIPQLISSPKGAVRYFTHMDNPEKYQYDPSEIFVSNGFDLDEFKKLNYSQIQDIKFSLVRYIYDKSITNYMDLVFDVAALNIDWRNVVMDNTIFFKEVIKNNKNKLKYEYNDSFRTIKGRCEQ